MEILKQYWWVIAGALVLLFLASKGSNPGGGVTVTQIGGTDQAALASIDAQAAISDQQNRYGLIARLLDYVQTGKQLEVTEQLAIANLASNERIAQTNAAANAQSAAYAYQLQSAQSSASLQAQLAAIRAAQSSANSNMWGNLLTTGLQSFMPLLGNWFGGNSNSNNGGNSGSSSNNNPFGGWSIMGNGPGGTPNWGGWF